MSKVTRIAVPIRLAHLTNEDIKDILRITFREGHAQKYDLKRVPLTDSMERTIRLPVDITEELRKISILLGLPQAFIATALIQIEVPHDIEDDILKAIELLTANGYEVR